VIRKHYLSQVDIANKILSRLKGQNWTSSKTINIWVEGEGSNIHLTRKVLHRLAAAEVLERVGQRRMLWRFKERDQDKQNWDPYRPFKKPDGTEAAEVKDEDLDATEEREDKDERAQQAVGVDEAARQLIGNLQAELLQASEKISLLQAEIDDTKERLEKTERLVASQTRTIEIKQNGKVVAKLKDKVLPPFFEEMVDLAKMGKNILLVGPSGCGKSMCVPYLAEVLGLEFGMVGCTSATTEAHFVGRARPNITKGTGVFEGTEFIRIYEGGGVFLADELDAADPNALLCLNAALSNGYCPLPDRKSKPRMDKHEDCIVIATANTFGRGANRIYAGRNQLDDATLDRFRIGTIECWYDEAIETKVCPDGDLRRLVWQVRSKVVAAGLRRVVSTRFLKDAYDMKVGRGWDDGRILAKLMAGWSQDERSKVA
jgi:energy-coupling factor transporter ATP-binding protein EcfA2